MKKIWYIFFLLSISFTSAISSEIKTRDVITVGIILETESLNAASDSKYTIKNNDKVLNFSPGNATLTLRDDTITAGKHSLKLPVKIQSGSYIVINKKIYRGNIILNLSKNKKLNVINELNIEDYLKGVLPKEVDPNWNSEALKSQAVISRSYVIKNLNRHACDNFNVCATVHCQVYGGASAETEECNKAVDDTKSEILTFNGEIAQTVFHASCGGYTENPKYIWDWKIDVPDYLKGIRDKYCSTSTHNKWCSTLSEQTIRKKLLNAGYKVDEIKSLDLSGKTSGHAKEFITIKHKQGKLKLNAYKFRLAVAPDTIKSSYIKNIKKDGKNFIFTGTGWGHRIGLCQCGAKVMAEKGFSYKEILKHYYPGTEVESIDYEK